ncbi:MAG TPA: hypothetical protein VFY73_21270 [Ideonella sp.]|uniref:hypothetical protein n=1 Tax=Ideonella sp. TaxID=1929293 RepID=UPI002E368655|nr:hypothetical protein [Ideonella sp.]HEX5686565.1 hypothetical protein [Ideonella sp.]
MLYSFRRIVALTATLSAVLLAACGGGGSEPATRLSYDTDRIRATAFRDQMADTNAFEDASVTLSVTATDPPDGDTYIAVQDSGSGFGGRPIEVVQLSDTSFQVKLYPQVNLASGVYQGQLTVVLCKNQACSSHHPVENASLPYEVTITPQLQAEVKVNGNVLSSLTSDIGNNSIGVESTDDEMVVEFTSSIPTSVHHSSGPSMLQVEIDPSSTDTYWKLRVTKPQHYSGGGLGISLWPEDSSKNIQHDVTLNVDLVPPAE